MQVFGLNRQFAQLAKFSINDPAELSPKALMVRVFLYCQLESHQFMACSEPTLLINLAEPTAVSFWLL
jgi:hypothetical protein